jgi:prevent-host-death family protein
MKAQRVGVRELRQNLIQYLRRVAAGECFEVTERNVPVAILAPLPDRSSALARLLSSGRLIPARLNLAELGLPPDRPREISISEPIRALENPMRAGCALDSPADAQEGGEHPARP